MNPQRLQECRNHGSRRASGDAFTMVELLVVVAIIVALCGLLFPVLGRGKAQAQQAGCLSNLRQIGIATQIYTDDTGSYPPAWVDGQTRWMDLLKPYLDKKADVYLCPADPKRIAVAWDPTIHMSYGINTFRFGDQAHCFWYPVRAAAVPRPSETILFADCTPGKYYCGGGSRFKEPVPDVDYRHPGKRFGAVFCDGHAEMRTHTQQKDWDASQ